LTEEVQADPSPREVQLGEVVRFLLRSIPYMAVAGLVCGALFWGYSQLTYSPVYRTSATLIVTQPTGASEFRRSPLSVAAYKQILDSPRVLGETRRRLVEEGVIRPDKALRAGRELRSKLFFSQGSRRESIAAPMIELSMGGADGERIARTVNVWAEAFIDRVREMIETSTTEALDIFATLHPQSEEVLQGVEKEKEKAVLGYMRRISSAWSSWGQKIAQHNQATQEMEGDFYAETAGLVAKAEDANEKITRTAELNALTTAFEELQLTSARVKEDLARSQAEVKALRRRLKNTPPFLEREDDGSVPVRVEPGSLATIQAADELNPVYVSLDGRLADAEVSSETLASQSERTERRLEEIADRIRELDVGLRKGEATVEQLIGRREAAWRSKRVQRDEAVANLERQRDRELESLRAERDSMVNTYNREISLESKRTEGLGASLTDATLAKEQLQIPDVRFGSIAVAPQEPEPRLLTYKTIIAFLVGSVLGLGLAVLRRALSQTPAEA